MKTTELQSLLAKAKELDCQASEQYRIAANYSEQGLLIDAHEFNKRGNSLAFQARDIRRDCFLCAGV